MKINRREIESQQLEKLQRLLSLVRAQNPFYKQKYAATESFSMKITSLKEFSQRIPFTTKDELVNDQLGHPPYGSNLTFSLKRYTRYSQTSGTSGQPLRWLDTPESWDSMIKTWLTVYRAGGVSAQDRLFIPFSFGPFLGFWTAFEAAVQLGCLCIPGGGLTTLGRLKCIMNNEINVLCCTPTYAIRLALVAAEENIDLSRSKVKSIVVAGEPGGSLPKTKEQIEDLWQGATVLDHHGMTEIGPASYQCPRQPGVLHIIESAYYPEVIDPTSSQPVPLGSIGELIITTLDRVSSPVLRYRTGDLVKVQKEARCACGTSELALIGGIFGRLDDMISVRGVNIFPSAIDNIIRNFASINEYRVELKVCKGMVELTLKIEINSTNDEDLTCLPKDLEKAILNAFSVRIPVAVVAQGTLPRFEMKAKRWVRL